MSDKLPTETPELLAEIDRLLQDVPQTTTRGRLSHLVTDLTKNLSDGGDGGLQSQVDLSIYEYVLQDFVIVKCVVARSSSN